MEKNSINTFFDNSSDYELLNIGNATYSNLKGNKYFTFKEGQLESYNNDIIALTNAKAKCENGGKVEYSAKNIARAKLLETTSTIAKIVNQQAEGNLMILKSSGFPTRKEAESYPEFPAPTSLKLKSGMAHGEIIVEVPVQKNTRVYCIYHAPMPASANIKEWNNVLSTKHTAIITGLTPGTQQAVRAGYVGTNGKINLSEIFTIFVQ
ncbi:hypothetical protein [uncultured Acetobacteroides sp.]|uniref:hypothetical protein n=1 Tax=uncultured Acetobacteroides sp. TaxID=1760811 RepID=UPI0029F53B79|nr:hypothetical protein [uncultured Acetobacteroides sp.]